MATIASWDGIIVNELQLISYSPLDQGSQLYEHHRIGLIPRLQAIEKSMKGWKLMLRYISTQTVTSAITSYLAFEQKARDFVSSDLVIGGLNHGAHVINKLSPTFYECGGDGSPIRIDLEIEFYLDVN
jgi:hypothetical protein